MPTYEYECKAGHTTLRFAPMGFAPERVPCDGADKREPCPHMARRVLSPPMLKHDGAYSHAPTQDAA